MAAPNFNNSRRPQSTGQPKDAALSAAAPSVVAVRDAKLPGVLPPLDAVLKAFCDLYFRLDSDGTIVEHYAPREKDLFVPPAQFLNRKMQDVLPAAAAHQFDDALAEVLRTGEPLSIEYSLPMAV